MNAACTDQKIFLGNRSEEYFFAYFRQFNYVNFMILNFQGVLTPLPLRLLDPRMLMQDFAV